MLIAEPFSPLFQQYQTCRDDKQTLIVNQTGITIGLLRLLGPFCMLLLVVIGVLFKAFCSCPSEQEQFEHRSSLHYTKTEKQKVLEAFAIAMLVHRDRLIVERLASTLSEEEREREGDNRHTERDRERVREREENAKKPRTHAHTASSLRALVEEVVDHYNNPETMQTVTEFLKTSGDEDVTKIALSPSLSPATVVPLSVVHTRSTEEGESPLDSLEEAVSLSPSKKDPWRSAKSRSSF